MKKNKKKKVRRRLKIKPFLTLMTIIVLIALSGYYLYHLQIKNIYISGNNFLSDHEIIMAANIKDYPRMFKYSGKILEKKIEKLDLVKSVKISKSLFGKLTIKVEEAIPLFYNRNSSNYVLSNGKTTNDYSFAGVPFLINYVPENIYKRLILELSNVQFNSIQMVSEIEYSPSKSGEIVIDDTRFLFRMNDGNEVYINLINIDRLDSYPLIYTILTEKGVLELDSDNESVVFKSYKSIEEAKTREESENGDESEE